MNVSTDLNTTFSLALQQVTPTTALSCSVSITDTLLTSTKAQDRFLQLIYSVLKATNEVGYIHRHLLIDFELPPLPRRIVERIEAFLKVPIHVRGKRQNASTSTPRPLEFTTSLEEIILEQQEETKLIGSRLIKFLDAEYIYSAINAFFKHIGYLETEEKNHYTLSDFLIRKLENSPTDSDFQVSPSPTNKDICLKLIAKMYALFEQKLIHKEAFDRSSIANFLNEPEIQEKYNFQRHFKPEDSDLFINLIGIDTLSKLANVDQGPNQFHLRSFIDITSAHEYDFSYVVKMTGSLYTAHSLYISLSDLLKGQAVLLRSDCDHPLQALFDLNLAMLRPNDVMRQNADYYKNFISATTLGLTCSDPHLESQLYQRLLSLSLPHLNTFYSIDSPKRQIQLIEFQKNFIVDSIRAVVKTHHRDYIAHRFALAFNSCVYLTEQEGFEGTVQAIWQKLSNQMMALEKTQANLIPPLINYLKVILANPDLNYFKEVYQLLQVGCFIALSGSHTAVFETHRIEFTYDRGLQPYIDIAFSTPSYFRLQLPFNPLKSLQKLRQASHIEELKLLEKLMPTSVHNQVIASELKHDFLALALPWEALKAEVFLFLNHPRVFFQQIGLLLAKSLLSQQYDDDLLEYILIALFYNQANIRSLFPPSFFTPLGIDLSVLDKIASKPNLEANLKQHWIDYLIYLHRLNRRSLFKRFNRFFFALAHELSTKEFEKAFLKLFSSCRSLDCIASLFDLTIESLTCSFLSHETQTQALSGLFLTLKKIPTDEQRPYWLQLVPVVEKWTSSVRVLKLESGVKEQVIKAFERLFEKSIEQLNPLTTFALFKFVFTALPCKAWNTNWSSWVLQLPLSALEPSFIYQIWQFAYGNGLWHLLDESAKRQIVLALTPQLSSNLFSTEERQSLSQDILFYLKPVSPYQKIYAEQSKELFNHLKIKFSKEELSIDQLLEKVRPYLLKRKGNHKLLLFFNWALQLELFKTPKWASFFLNLLIDLKQQKPSSLESLVVECFEGDLYKLFYTADIQLLKFCFTHLQSTQNRVVTLTCQAIAANPKQIPLSIASLASYILQNFEFEVIDIQSTEHFFQLLAAVSFQESQQLAQDRFQPFLEWIESHFEDLAVSSTFSNWIQPFFKNFDGFSATSPLLLVWEKICFKFTHYFFSHTKFHDGIFYSKKISNVSLTLGYRWLDITFKALNTLLKNQNDKELTSLLYHLKSYPLEYHESLKGSVGEFIEQTFGTENVEIIQFFNENDLFFLSFEHPLINFDLASTNSKKASLNWQSKAISYLCGSNRGRKEAQLGFDLCLKYPHIESLTLAFLIARTAHYSSLRSQAFDLINHLSKTLDPANLATCWLNLLNACKNGGCDKVFAEGFEGVYHKISNFLSSQSLKSAFTLVLMGYVETLTHFKKGEEQLTLARQLYHKLTNNQALDMILLPGPKDPDYSLVKLRLIQFFLLVNEEGAFSRIPILLIELLNDRIKHKYLANLPEELTDKVLLKYIYKIFSHPFALTEGMLKTDWFHVIQLSRESDLYIDLEFLLETSSKKLTSRESRKFLCVVVDDLLSSNKPFTNPQFIREKIKELCQDPTYDECVRLQSVLSQAKCKELFKELDLNTLKKQIQQQLQNTKSKALAEQSFLAIVCHYFLQTELIALLVWLFSFVNETLKKRSYRRK